jgi:putative two-component system response regulator
MMMNIKVHALRVLMIDDSEDDVQLTIRELKKGKYDLFYERVENADAMKKALLHKEWDIILCDYNMPDFNAVSAITLLQKEDIDIPVIIISGSANTEEIIECIRLGAHDYFMKGNLSRLCPAIDRELANAEIRRKKKQIQSQSEVAIIKALSQNIIEQKHEKAQFQHTIENLKKVIDTSIQVIVSVVEVRDPLMHGHHLRATHLACAIADDIGLEQEQKDAIRMAGAMYDIGTLSVPTDILSKFSKLTDLEVSLIKEHPRKGYEVLMNVESPWPLAEIIYQHHERMDGSGYPRSLSGDAILMESRVLAVSDVLDSMISLRPYRPALDLATALEEIEKNKGILYDHAVVDACLKLFREGRNNSQYDAYHKEMLM